jgi:hypothetical protein
VKRIAICFDGTWNKPADENLSPASRVETNVSRFFDSIKERTADGVRQVRWYDQGVGTHFYDRFTGATTPTPSRSSCTGSGNGPTSGTSAAWEPLAVDESVARPKRDDPTYAPRNQGLSL